MFTFIITRMPQIEFRGVNQRAAPFLHCRCVDGENWLCCWHKLKTLVKATTTSTTTVMVAAMMVKCDDVLAILYTQSTITANSTCATSLPLPLARRSTLAIHFFPCHTSSIVAYLSISANRITFLFMSSTFVFPTVLFHFHLERNIATAIYSTYR